MEYDVFAILTFVGLGSTCGIVTYSFKRKAYNSLYSSEVGAFTAMSILIGLIAAAVICGIVVNRINNDDGVLTGKTFDIITDDKGVYISGGSSPNLYVSYYDEEKDEFAHVDIEKSYSRRWIETGEKAYVAEVKKSFCGIYEYDYVAYIGKETLGY